MINHETGEAIQFVTSADIHMGAREVNATLYFDNPQIDIVCDATVEETKHLVYDQNDLESIAAAMAVLVKRRNELERL